MTWTNEPPTVAGWYWMRTTPRGKAMPFELTAVPTGTTLFFVLGGASAESFVLIHPRCQWCGPIPLPQEPPQQPAGE